MHGDDQRVRGRRGAAWHGTTVPRRRAATRALVGALVVACTAGALHGARAAGLPPLDLVASPPTITPGEVAAHRDEVVVLELEVARASAAPGRVVLEPAAGADGAPPVRVVLVPPLLGEPGARLARRYAGHRIRVVGRVREFGGAYEVFSTDPEAIVLLDVAPTPAPLAAAPGPSAAAPAGTRAPAAPPSPGAAATAGSASCAAARDAWRAAAAAARPVLARLADCLAGKPGCGDALRAVQAALAEVTAAEEDVRWSCAGGA